MKVAIGVVGGLLAGAAIGWGVALQYGGLSGRGGTKGGVGPSAGASGDALFELDGVKYGEGDLSAATKSEIFEAETQAYERMQALTNELALKFVMAKEKDPAAKISDPLPGFDALVTPAKPTEEQMKAVFEANKERLPKDVTFEQVKGELERYVMGQNSQEALRAKHKEMTEKGRFKFLGAAPLSPMLELPLGGHPAKGLGSATFVEVSDYLCPHCQAVHAEVEEVRKASEGKARSVQVNYSLNPAGLSGLLARGAHCALQGGEEAFWKFHDAAFKTAIAKGWKTADPENADALNEVVAAAGLDKDKIGACVATPEAAAAVTATIDAFKKIGVSGTPTFFVNGRRLGLTGNQKLQDAVNAAMAAK